MARNDKNLVIENATIAFRNFAGKEDTYNREGDRNFAILLDEDRAAEMEQAGWNVKRLKPRDDEEYGTPYVQVAVSYKQKPPKIVVVTSKGMTAYTEDMVEMLDWVDIETADVRLTPYEWAINGKTGVKAYLLTLYLKIEEDYLQLKWESFVNDNKQIESGSSEVIDGEFWEDQKQIGA